MAEPFLGEIKMFGGNYAPRGWAFCSGQSLSINQNTALFSLLGTTYGGNGQTTFNLPDLRGRVPVHFGQGPGLSGYDEGEAGGSENAALAIANLPAHNHPMQVNNNTTGMATTAQGNYLNSKTESGESVASTGLNAATLNVASVGNTGSGVPFSILQPFLSIAFIIALEGIYPSRS